MGNKKLVIALGVVFGIPVVLAAVALISWWRSPILRERAYEASLFSRVYIFQKDAAAELRHYPSRAAAISLVAFLNFVDTDTAEGDALGEEALASLCLLSGQDFGTGFEGAQYNFSWSPPSGDSWSEVIENVNGWAMETFGADALGSFSMSISIEQNGDDGESGDLTGDEDDGSNDGDYEEDEP